MVTKNKKHKDKFGWPKAPAFFGGHVPSLSRSKNNIYKNGENLVGKSISDFRFWTFFLSIFQNWKTLCPKPSKT
jgi:hypothetical protein